MKGRLSEHGIERFQKLNASGVSSVSGMSVYDVAASKFRTGGSSLTKCCKIFRCTVLFFSIYV